MFGPICFECEPFTVCFPLGLLIVAFGQEEDFTQSQLGRKSRDLVRFRGKKIEAGCDLNCMSRGLGCDDKAATGK